MIKKYACFLLLFFVYTAYAQDSLNYRFELFGSANSGKYTPFWITSNTYGMVPLQPNNGYIRGDISWKHSFLNGIKLEAEADIVTAAKHTSSVWVHQLYAAAAYRNMSFFVGAKERYVSMLDKNLSMGDMTYSTNARPMPEINLAFPNYTNLPFTKGYIQFKGDFAVGKSFDNDYILRTINEGDPYSIDMIWHHKSLFLKWEDPNGRIPFWGLIGVEHGAQWAGWTSHGDFGKNPNSFRDFIRIVLCESGDEHSILGEQINVLGNHLGTYNIKIAYRDKQFQTALYKQHFFEDNSGTELANWRDGIWGGELTFFNQPLLQKIVLEYLQTTNQSGPFHFLKYDRVLYPNIRGGGGDDYYNNSIYISGWSHFGRAIGNALLTSPEYNEDRSIRFKNNRVKSIHLGLSGKISDEFSYRMLFTEMYGWGTHSKPFLKRKDNLSSLIECIYNPKKLDGWQIGLQASFDKGNLYGNNYGGSLKISKTGFIGK